MDYWQHVDWEAVENWHDLKVRLTGRTFWYLTKSATRLVWDADFEPGDVLVFGSETRGLPPSILAEDPMHNLGFPMRGPVRSLNLASTATAVIYEALRQFRV
jgi:tRNA (cytidine/uridine-2'-O-)-methyltransferase